MIISNKTFISPLLPHFSILTSNISPLISHFSLFTYQLTFHQYSYITYYLIFLPQLYSSYFVVTCYLTFHLNSHQSLLLRMLPHLSLLANISGLTSTRAGTPTISAKLSFSTRVVTWSGTVRPQILYQTTVSSVIKRTVITIWSES